MKDFEFSLAFSDGTTRHVLGYGTPLLDKQQRPRGAVHVLVTTFFFPKKQFLFQIRRSTTGGASIAAPAMARSRFRSTTVSSVI